MEYEEYKSKLQMLRDSLNELRDYRSKRYNATCDYIRSIKTTEGKIQDQLIFLHKNHTDDENDLIAQLEFVEFLDDRGKYTELTKELMDILQDRQLVSSSGSASVNPKQIDSTISNRDIGQAQLKENLPKPYKETAANVTTERSQTNAVIGTQKVDECRAEDKDASVTKHEQKQQAAEDKVDPIYADFMKAYNEGALKNDAQRLNICDAISTELMWIGFDDWKDFAARKEITLVGTTRQPQYFAYDGADYIAEIKQRGKYYLLVPTKFFEFNEMQIVNNAMLAFFDLPGDGRDCLNGVKPKLVRPAVLKKEANGEYVLCKDKQGKLCKGEYKI